MTSVDYWFASSDTCESPHDEWLRHTGIAIATAAHVLGERPDVAVAVSVGTIATRQAEVVSFRRMPAVDALAAALRDVGASRHIGVTLDDPEVEALVAPFAFLFRGWLIRPSWYGRNNEISLEQWCGVRTACASNEADEQVLLEQFRSEAPEHALDAFLRRRR